MTTKDILRYLAAFVFLAIFWVTVFELENFGAIPLHLFVANIAVVVVKAIAILLVIITVVLVLARLLPKNELDF